MVSTRWNRPRGRRLGHQRGTLGAAAGLTEDHDARRVAAELGDVIADPCESKHQVELPGVAGVFEPLSGEGFAEIHVAEGVETVVDANHDDIAAAGEAGAVVELRVGGAVRERAAVDVEHHGAFLAVSQTGRPYVQVQAVFALRGLRQVAGGSRGA